MRQKWLLYINLVSCNITVTIYATSSRTVYFLLVGFYYYFCLVLSTHMIMSSENSFISAFNLYTFLFPSLVLLHFLRLPFNIDKKYWEGVHPSVQFSSVTQSCLTLCNPMDHSTPGLPVHHQLPEFTQTHAHWVGDAIQQSHPLASPSPPAFNLSQHQGLFKWVSSSPQVDKVL